MKKSVLVIALAFGVSGAFAQDLTSKKGEPFLPEAEDWAISMNADPIFYFIGNAFNNNSDNAAPGVNWMNQNQTIIGKKFIDDKNAYRVVVRLGFNSSSYKNFVTDNANTSAVFFPAQAAEVEDKFKMSSTNVGIGVGKEMRRGKTRLQGFYGADAMIWISSSKMKYEYGNEMSATTGSGTTTNPNSTQWNADGTVASENGVNNRELQSKSGMTFGIGVRGFIGAEYFIFPKIAIGAEYGWGIGFQTMGKGKVTTEEQGLDSNGDNVVAEIERESAGASKFGIDTDLNQGNVFGFKGSNTGTASLKVTFHF
ncbi:MAG: hypothetical protein M3R27_15460 [Bacteroidota bacterium]|nr:hypothetical protein [Bacteroidota bacterium]